MTLEGKTAVVTGAARGIGHAYVERLAADGADVVAVDIGDPAGGLAGLPGGGEKVGLVCDISRPDQVDAVVKTVLDRFGRVDILVNNAGMVDVHPAEKEPLDDFRKVIDVNLVAPFALSQHAARAMLNRGDGGAIVNVASVLGLVGVGQIPQAGYAASKGGIVNLTRELSAQWSRKGIRVNAIAPGWFESEMTADMFSEEGKGREWVARRAPMKRHGREGELDGALVFLASDASSYVTGHVLAVDGGWTSI